jgi:hypothetical protein
MSPNQENLIVTNIFIFILREQFIMWRPDVWPVATHGCCASIRSSTIVTSFTRLFSRKLGGSSTQGTKEIIIWNIACLIFFLDFSLVLKSNRFSSNFE